MVGLEVFVSMRRMCSNSMPLMKSPASTRLPVSPAVRTIWLKLKKAAATAGGASNAHQGTGQVGKGGGGPYWGTVLGLGVR
jgi:hypothetical protein